MVSAFVSQKNPSGDRQAQHYSSAAHIAQGAAVQAAAHAPRPNCARIHVHPRCLTCVARVQLQRSVVALLCRAVVAAGKVHMAQAKVRVVVFRCQRHRLPAVLQSLGHVTQLLGSDTAPLEGLRGSGQYGRCEAASKCKGAMRQGRRCVRGWRRRVGSASGARPTRTSALVASSAVAAVKCWKASRNCLLLNASRPRARACGSRWGGVLRAGTALTRAACRCSQDGTVCGDPVFGGSSAPWRPEGSGPCLSLLR